MRISIYDLSLKDETLNVMHMNNNRRIVRRKGIEFVRHVATILPGVCMLLQINQPTAENSLDLECPLDERDSFQ